MKKIILTVITIALSFIINAQECSTIWPYIYKEFQDGTVYMKGGQKINCKVNIHVRNSTLQYLDGEKIRETKSDDVILVEVNNDKFMSVDGKIMKVLSSNEKGFIAVLTLGDFESIYNTGGAYGSSSNSSATMKLSSIEIGGETNTNHMELRNNLESGVTIPIEYEYFIVTGGEIYEASRKGIESKLSKERKAQLKTFLKNNKIKWKDSNSLLTLIDFLNE